MFNRKKVDIPGFQKDGLVSVIIPLYNGEEYVRECLHSVYAQTYRPLEVIVVDDGSTDRSVEVVGGVKGEKKIIRQKNKNVSWARNVGVQASKGEYIAFLDQDDCWLPQKLTKQVAVFQKQSYIDLVFTDIMKFSPSGREHHARDKHCIALSLTDSNLFRKLVKKNVLMPSAVMIKRQSFISAGCFDTDFRTCGDYEMWLRMAALGMKFRYLPEPLTYYRQHRKNASKNTEIMYYERIKAIQKTFANPNLSETKKKWERIGLASAYMLGAHTFFSAKRYDHFLTDASKACFYDKRVINVKFVTRYLRSWFHVKMGKGCEQAHLE